MKFGLQINRFDWPGAPATIGPKFAEITRAAEEAGFESIWVMDHYYQIEPGLGSKEDPMLEAYSALNFAAAVTERVRLGVLVTGVVYRHPGFLIKQVSTLDVLSGGRANLGIGAAWYWQEAQGLGFPFPSTGERFEQLEEVLQIAKQVWSGDFSSYKGKHFKLEAPINSPQPITKPHPPILIGGEGEKKTLRLVAQYGDACNLFARNGVDGATKKLGVLRNHCEALGRDYDEIEKTVLGSIDLSTNGASEVVDQIGLFTEIGIQHYVLGIPNVSEIEPIERFGSEIIPRF
ncbi:MAG: LLM class F420-dependent oxidoreductase [Anaerolineae bacterium]|nr:MAG: LLM class F420-dependent oxidoreductase [Anaerolineae bacterium]